MKLKYKFLTQSVPEGYIAITTDEDADKFQGIVRMNKTGMEIFDMLSSDQTEDSIVEALREKYEDDDNKIPGAVHKFVEYLKEEGILE